MLKSSKIISWEVVRKRREEKKRRGRKESQNYVVFKLFHSHSHFISSFLSHSMALLLHLPLKYKSILLLLLCLPHIKILYTQSAEKKGKIKYSMLKGMLTTTLPFRAAVYDSLFPSSSLCASFFLIIECESVFGKIDFSLIISFFFIIISDSYSPR
jgi:hypothetical protein